MSEELQVIFFAVEKSRTDVVQQAISSLKSTSSVEECAALISTGRAVDAVTPLHLAVEVGNADVIRALLQAGADVLAKTSNGERPYDLAKLESAKQAFHVFLYESLAVGKINHIERLVAGGIPTDTLLVDGSPMLCVAASFGMIEATQSLLAQGCRVDSINTHGQTALHIACIEKNEPLVKILLDEGASAEVRDSIGRTPLDILSDASSSIKELLLNPPMPTFQCSSMTKSSKFAPLRPLATSLHSASIDSHQSSQFAVASNASVRARSGSSARARSLHEPEYDDEDVHHDGMWGEDPSPKLVLWPAPQRQKRSQLGGCFTFSSSKTVAISAEGSLLDPVRSLVELLASLGISAEVAPVSAKAQIRLAIDRNSCPGWNRYDLVIDQSMIYLTASDALALRYGVQCLSQLLLLHSTPTAPTKQPSNSTGFDLPLVTISDWPDIENRCVMWSCRECADVSVSELRAAVGVMTECRLNMMFLVIDPVGEVKQSNPPCWKTIQDVEESCTKELIQLIPTVTLSSLNHEFPSESVKFFSHSMVQLVLLLEERIVTDELMAADERHSNLASSPDDSPRLKVITSIDVDNAARAYVANQIALVQEAGFQTVILVTSPWLKHIANPQAIAFSFGLQCSERPAGLLFPAIHFAKPLICSQEFIRSVASSIAKSLQQSNSMCVLPAFIDSEFMMPGLLLKYLMFLHGGFTWNYATSMDMLFIPGGPGGNSGTGSMHSDGDGEQEIASGQLGESSSSEGAFEGSIIRDVLSLVLFRRPPDQETDHATSAILSLLTGELFAGQGESHHHTSDPLLARVDKLLWALLTSPAAVSDMMIPSKAEAALCLKYYKRLLNAARWNDAGAGFSGQSFSKGVNLSWLWGSASEAPVHSLEVEELLSVVHLLSVLTKAIVLAHGAMEKTGLDTGRGMSLGLALQNLPPGLNSDIANSLLEALERCVEIWRKRFSTLALLDPSNDSTNQKPAARLVPFRQARARFFRAQIHGIPTMAFLGTTGGIRDKLPRPMVVDDTFDRLFSRKS